MKKHFGLSHRGFTLVELLVVVVIIGVLSSIGVPAYVKSVEKARATEAMKHLKAANDAVYAYSSEKGKCPTEFRQLLIEIPGTGTGASVQAKYFTYTMGATAAPIPGTTNEAGDGACPGVLATRHSGNAYYIWNPFSSGGSSRTLACNGNTAAARKICNTLGLYRNQNPF